jgi:nitrite reductase/ring-hydroxylating ferredoxin subunit
MSDWAKVGTMDDVKEGQVIQVIVDGEEVALAKVNGELLATSDVCSHEFVHLSGGWMEGEEIECPEHGSRFHMKTGEVANLPATQPIPVYDVKVENEEVFVKGPRNE